MKNEIFSGHGQEQEVKLQSREQNRALRTQADIVEAYREGLEAFKNHSEQIALLEKNIRTDTEKRTALLFLDIRDALVRGLAHSQRIQTGKSFFRRPRREIEGISEGYSGGFLWKNDRTAHRESGYHRPCLFHGRPAPGHPGCRPAAGLEVVRIINEPAAAALAYEQTAPQIRRVLIYDLGGGTFDVSIVKIEEGVMEVLSSTGDNRLGGDDFDDKIVDALKKHLQSKHQVDVDGAPDAGPEAKRPHSGFR